MPDDALGATLKIGSTVWRFDLNHRVYARGSMGPPIYREHFVAMKIESETSRSWVTTYGHKIPKASASDVCGNYFLTAEAVERDIWVKDHRYKIRDAMDRCGDAAILKQIASLLGYDPEIK